jgi:uncharacterized membrane protein (UPF0127 family)
VSKIKPKNKQKKKSNFNIYIISAAVLAAIIVIYFLYFKKPSEPEWVKGGEVTFLNKDTREHLSKIEVEVAKNPTQRQQGLMFRTQMDEDKGMIFIFERSEIQSFWMKNTLIPLDIIFIDEKGVINTIYRNTIPYSERSLPSKQMSQFVVEVNAGYCLKHNINEGDLIEYKLDNIK